MEKKKEITMFWGILIVFIAIGTGVVIAAINNVGIFITGIIGFAFSLGVYKLPDFFVENKRNSPSLRYVCTVGAGVTFVCLVGFAVTIQSKDLSFFELNRIRMVQCVLVVVYFLTALVVSKRIQQEEEKIGNDPTRSRPVH